MNRTAPRPSLLSTDYTALYTAWKRFKRGKRANRTIYEFAYDLERNLTQLSTDLSNG